MKQTLSTAIFFLHGMLACAQVADSVVAQAIHNGRQANEALKRSMHLVKGWLRHADPVTGLLPRRLSDSVNLDTWNAQDCAADLYPFLVLTSYFTDRDLFEGRMKRILKTETKLTSRLGACPATYSFSRKGFKDEVADTSNIIFGSAEYMKDGLLPLTEWLGKTEWSERMLNILDDLHKLVDVVQEIKGNYLGNTAVTEVNGDLLQVLSRVYWMTGNKEYLDWAIRIGDTYLLTSLHPTNTSQLRLRDHGCEIILGLCELYATVHFALPEKKKQYEAPLHQLLDRILEIGRNEHGMFYDVINPREGKVIDMHLADTWGYTLDGYYIVYSIDNIPAYRNAVLTIFSNLNKHYRNHDWEANADGYADAIESAINLYNREPDVEVIKWIDSEIKRMWDFQKKDGVVEGWYGDGNFARTSIMYALMKTGGTHISPWKEDVVFGAVKTGEQLEISLSAGKAWSGKLYFDRERYKENLHLPFDWPRINQFPEWYSIKRSQQYKVLDHRTKKVRIVSGKELLDGYSLKLQKGEVVQLVVTPL